MTRGRWSSWLRHRPADSLAWEIDEELATHVALRVEENVARGMTPADARAEALRRIGPRAPAAAASRHYRGRVEGARRALGFDIRDAARTARRTPATTLTALVVVAVGLGTIFGAIRLADALLARSPGGVGAPDALVSVSDSHDGEHVQLLARPAFEAIRRHAPDATPFVWSERDLQVIHAAGSQIVATNLVSGDYFMTLRAGAAAGRTIGPDDEAEARPVAVVSANLASRIAGSADAAVGSGLTVNGQPFTVVGVAERRFRGLESGHPVDLWLPVSTEPSISTPNVFPDGSVRQGYWSAPDIGWLRAAARLPEGLPIDALADRMTQALRTDHPVERAENRRAIVEPRPWISPFSGDRASIEAVAEPIGWAVLAALLLTAACLGSLYVGRAADRQREHAMRLALGAPRGRVIRLVNLEIAWVVFAGAAAGAVASQILLTLVGRLELARGVLVSDALAPIDGRAFVQFAAMAAVLVLLACAMPALFVRRLAARPSVGSSRASAAGHRLRRGLMVAQVGMGVALLSAALLLTSSIGRLLDRPLGFDAARVAYMSLDPTGAGLDAAETAALARRWLASPLGQEASLAIADNLPFTQNQTLFLHAPDSAWPQAYPTSTTRIGGPYFATLGAAIVAGRAFTVEDGDRPVAILSAPLAQSLWPDEPAIGRTINVGGTNGTPHEVVGVVAGLRDASLRAEPMPRLYLPYGDDAEGLAVLARPASGAAAPLVESLNQLASGFDRRLVVFQSGTLDNLARSTIEQRLLFRLLASALGMGSLVMVAAGVWGLSHGTLRRRWREFGIRQALGAGPGEVARLAFGDARFVALAGGLAGLAGGWQAGRILESWLFGVQPWDPAALGFSALLVIGAAIAGSIQPALRASRIDAASLLRDG